jgi:putative membrane protein
MMWWYGGGGPGWGGWLAMSLSMVVFWGLVVWGVIALIRWTRGNPVADNYPSERETPQQILARRLASGEISEEEYESRLRVLTRV